MSCPHNHHLSAYHDGELNLAARAEMDQHLAQCAECSAELAQLRALSGLFAAEERPRLSQIAMYRLHDKADRVMERDILRVVRAMQAIAACVLVTASLWLMNSSQQTSQADSQEAVQAAPPWLDVAVTATAETNSLDTTTPAAAWYLADVSSRSDDMQ